MDSRVKRSRKDTATGNAQQSRHTAQPKPGRSLRSRADDLNTGTESSVHGVTAWPAALSPPPTDREPYLSGAAPTPGRRHVPTTYPPRGHIRCPRIRQRIRGPVTRSPA